MTQVGPQAGGQVNGRWVQAGHSGSDRGGRIRRQGSAPHTLVLQRREGSSRSVPYSGPQGEGVVTPLQTGRQVGLPCEQAT